MKASQKQALRDAFSVLSYSARLTITHVFRYHRERPISLLDSSPRCLFSLELPGFEPLTTGTSILRHHATTEVYYREQRKEIEKEKCK